MPGTYTHTFNTPVYKGTSTVHTGLFINGQWVDPIDKGTIDVINPTTGEVITAVSIGTAKDVDIAVDAARKASATSWGLKCPGNVRGKMLSKLADLIEEHRDEFAALEALNVGKVFGMAKMVDLTATIDCIRYFAGWAGKMQGKVIETHEGKLAYTRNEPFKAVGLILPWNFPLMILASKLGPALATGNSVVLKASEFTPLTTLRLADLIVEAGFPPGVFNIVNGDGPTVGSAITSHPLIEKVAFTGSTPVGRNILKSSAETNLKVVTLELGGKNPSLIFDDADLDEAVKWASHGIFFNMGQACTAGSRIYVQEGVYEEFLGKFTAAAQALTAATGDPFGEGIRHGPQVSKQQFDRVMSYIESGKKAGATVHLGGERHNDKGYFIKPTIFTDTTPDMKIVQEEIFGPVGVVVKFKDEAEAIALANDTTYGLACSVFSQNISRAIRVAHELEAGTAWINMSNMGDISVPFGGYKQSGIGRDLGEQALSAYTEVKSVHVNLGIKL